MHLASRGLYFSNSARARIWGQELNTNFLFSIYLGAPELPDHPGNFLRFPGMRLCSLGFEGHTKLFGSTPFTWKTPPHRKVFGPKSLSLCCFFVSESSP